MNRGQCQEPRLFIVPIRREDHRNDKWRRMAAFEVHPFVAAQPVIWFQRRIVEPGFGKRVMFGSDQMVWPETIEVAIQSIEQAALLTPEQKRDIFYNNAARFLKLTETEIARHTGR